MPRQEPQARIIRRAAIFLSSACRRNRFFRARSGRIEIESRQKFVLCRHGRKVRLQMNTNAVSQVLATKKMLVSAVAHPKSPASLEKMGIYVSRYGLVVTLLLIGVLKFSAAEAHGIQPLVANSPLMSWLYRVFSLQGVSNLIGQSRSSSRCLSGCGHFLQEFPS